MQSAATATIERPLPRVGPGLQFAASLASIFGPLNSTMVAVALPSIRSEFHIGVGSLTWLVSSYLIAVAVCQPASGRLGDAFGHLRTVQAGLVVLIVFSLATAFAWNFPALVVMRSLQGIAAALTMPNVLAFLRKRVEPERLGTVLGVNGAAISAGAALGPVLGGLLLLAGDWRLMFVANVPVALFALWLVARIEPDEGRGREALALDGVSMAALTAAFTGIALIGSAFRLHNPALTVIGFAVLPVGVALYALRYRAKGQGVVDLRLFTRRNYAAAAAAVSLSNLLMYTTLIAMPVYLVDLRHLSDFQVGFVLFSMSAALVLFSPLAGSLADRMGSRPLMLASACAVLVSVAGLVFAVDGWQLAAVIGFLVALGMGMGLGSAAQQSAALQAWPPGVAGSASGTFSMMRYVGSITGAAMLAAILGAHPGSGAFQAVFAVLAAFGVANILVSLLIRRAGAPATPSSSRGF